MGHKVLILHIFSDEQLCWKCCCCSDSQKYDGEFTVEKTQKKYKLTASVWIARLLYKENIL